MNEEIKRQSQSPTEKEIERLYNLYYDRDKEFESAKRKRTLLSIIGFTCFCFWVLCSIGNPTGWNIIPVLIVSIVMAGFHFFINNFIFLWLFSKGREESEILQSIKKHINELENEHTL